MYEILEKEAFSDVTKLMVVSAPDVAHKAKAGQFIVIRVVKEGERIPLTIADFDRERGTITMVFQEVGKSTMHLGSLQPGDALASLTGPLGRPTEIENYGTVICVGGGVGIAPVYPIARELRAAGNHIISIIGARTKDLLFWEDKMRAVSDELIVCTDDGTYGRKALVTVPLKELLEERDDVAHIWAIGPAIMMKFCSLTTKPFGVTTIVSLNSIMVDGTGMCGSCRVEVGGQTKFVCVDGPEFDGHQVDWDLLLARQRIYLPEEKLAKERFLAERHACMKG
ncbi:MAG: sulfide/dihydroorotate dehydrogenase-like FAD/NAD-binding protein [Chloroflexi bacterium]|nr:sulfide/dihydroorotate dehydrogenase-like FAD/NAD-binding protein [Anaerolineae bacterium]RLC69762.1 MAG: sulfide/dihydroorotate dehydrogenase-like FAD/NAD-binding protein [Chloroflexota bacterium]